MRIRTHAPLATGSLVALLAVLSGPGAAWAQFGRNKVQYEAFDFKVIRTDHFEVYYYAAERAAALDAARMAERAYARLSRILQHEFRERKPIILYASHSDFQQTNALGGFIDEGTGGVTEFLKHRVILPFTGSYREFDHVLTHELVHAFQIDILFRRMYADANPFSFQPPLWFMEGMAEYLSLGRIDALTAAWIRDAALSGYLMSIDELTVRGGYLAYRMGQSLWAHIGAHWGDEVVGEILQKAPRVGIQRAFESTLGISLKQLGDEWLESVRSTYLPQIADHESPQRLAQRVTDHHELQDPWFLAPALSPDGKKLVYLSQRGGYFFDLWLADAETGKPLARLVEAARDPGFESLRYLNSSASFSPDGRFLAFSAKIGGEDALYIFDVKRRNVVKKLRFELNGIENPSWSPDGEQLVFTGLDGGITDLFITDREGKALHRLTNDKYAQLLPAWSPDGRYIAFGTDQGETDFEGLTYGNYRVALYDLDVNQVIVLPYQETGKNLNPQWSPDGRYLAWISDRTGINNLYLYDLRSERLYQATNLLSGIIGITPTSPALAWAKDSGRMIFLHFERAGYNLYRVDDPLSLPLDPVVEMVAQERGSTKARGAVRAAPEAPAPAVAAAPPRALRPGAESEGSFYRAAEGGFRPSEALPVASGRGPLSVASLLDSAALALPDTSDFTLADYAVKFSPDIVGRPVIGAQVGGYYGNGVYGGSMIALSDILGNHNLFLAGSINGSLSDAAFLTSYAYVRHRTNVFAGIQQVPLYRFLGSELFVDPANRLGRRDVFVRDVIRQAAVGVSYPFSVFRRLEFSMTGASFSRDLVSQGFYGNGEGFRDTERLDDIAYAQPAAAIVFDNTLFGWTGPILGRRYRFEVARTMGGLSFTEGLADFRNYVNLGNKLVFATRFVTLARVGTDADEFTLYWGGPYFIRGYDGGSFDFGDADSECRRSQAAVWPNPPLSPCPVRDQLIGSSVALFNSEVRFPLVSELQISFLGSFPPVEGLVFFDGGLAWNNEICLDVGLREWGSGCEVSQKVTVVWDRPPGADPYLVREPVFSYGMGVRMNLFYTVLRIDYSRPLNRPFRRGGLWSVSFGPSF
ncbi:MAG: PD40 domain-containing protein [Gemmatimonadetes bacterium]|nr:PD40 domain-containing protein [Gemmatimonadota bacterium]